MDAPGGYGDRGDLENSILGQLEFQRALDKMPLYTGGFERSETYRDSSMFDSDGAFYGHDTRNTKDVSYYTYDKLLEDRQALLSQKGSVLSNAQYQSVSTEIDDTSR